MARQRLRCVRCRAVVADGDPTREVAVLCLTCWRGMIGRLEDWPAIPPFAPRNDDDEDP